MTFYYYEDAKNLVELQVVEHMGTHFKVKPIKYKASFGRNKNKKVKKTSKKTKVVDSYPQQVSASRKAILKRDPCYNQYARKDNISSPSKVLPPTPNIGGCRFGSYVQRAEGFGQEERFPQDDKKR